MTTTARIKTSVAVICAVFAILIAAGLSVRGKAIDSGSAIPQTTAVATAPVAAPATSDDEFSDEGLESDGELD